MTSFYSTGSIIKNIESSLKGEYEFYRATTDESGDNLFVFNKDSLGRELNKIPTQLFGRDGFAYNCGTKKLIKWIGEIKPDLIHLHNPHGYYMNVELLLNYAYLNKIPVIYTLHDCWSFTGRCAHFDKFKCEKWISGCEHCPHKLSYPPSRLFDTSKTQYQKKKELFVNHDIKFVVPSNWLKNLTKKSFLKNEEVVVINNGIDVSVFNERVNKDELPNEVSKDKKIILSVASPFTNEKGLEDINKLYDLIDKEKYQIVLVGIEKEYKTKEGIVRIEKTKNKRLLACLYQNSYVTVLFSHQENYPTVLLESLASGTPVVTYDIGGCPEIAINDVTGYVVKENDIFGAYEAIEKIDKINRDKCKEIGDTHSIEKFIKEYHELYKKILQE